MIKRNEIRMPLDIMMTVPSVTIYVLAAAVFLFRF